VFGLCCLCVEAVLILRSAHHEMKFDASSISRMTGLTLIVTSPMVLVTGRLFDGADERRDGSTWHDRRIFAWFCKRDEIVTHVMQENSNECGALAR